ncbi:MAG: ComF family protein [Candidatus Aenigmarchaeota archaeon]|nr:ComF family protein [Candidatus Aenigmarchaeota archaeon]
MVNFLKIKNFLLDLLFPIKCLDCGKEGVWICNHCLDTIPSFNHFICPVCQRPSSNGQPCPDCQKKSALNSLWIATNYQHPLVKKLITNFKYQRVRSLAKPLGQLLVKLLNNLQVLNLLPDSSTLLIPVPLYWQRERQRGFNQSNLLVKQINKHFPWKINTSALKRVKNTQSQTQFNAKERQRNIANAFQVIRPNEIKNKQIILLDDVFTTGATLQEAAKMLHRAGAKQVYGLALAKRAN